MLTLFTVLTADDWHLILFDCMDVPTAGWFAPLYFLSFYVLAAHISLNLFIASVLESFENAEAGTLLEEEQAAIAAQKEKEKAESVKKTLGLFGPIFAHVLKGELAERVMIWKMKVKKKGERKEHDGLPNQLRAIAESMKEDAGANSKGSSPQQYRLLFSRVSYSCLQQVRNQMRNRTTKTRRKSQLI